MVTGLERGAVLGGNDQSIMMIAGSVGLFGGFSKTDHPNAAIASDTACSQYDDRLVGAH